MTQPLVFSDPRLATLDGFRVEIDPAHERADVVLDWPPLNVISMPQRAVAAARTASMSSSSISAPGRSVIGVAPLRTFF